MYRVYHTPMQELERESAGDFVGIIRMENVMFKELLLMVGPRITKGRAGKPCGRPLEDGLKLEVMLRFLASGNSYRSIAFSFRVPHNTISKFIPGVCQAMTDEYIGETMPVFQNSGVGVGESRSHSSSSVCDHRQTAVSCTM